MDSFHFSNLSRSKENMKKALLQLQIQFKKSGLSEIYLITSILGFSSKKNEYPVVIAISANLLY